MGNYPSDDLKTEKEIIRKRKKNYSINEMPVDNRNKDLNDERKPFNSVDIMTTNSKQNRTKKNNEINNEKNKEENDEIGVNYDKSIENNNNLINEDDKIKKSKCKSKNKETEKELLENNRLLENKSNQKDDLIEKEKYIRFRENQLKELEQKLKVKQIEINNNENVLKKKK